jgi:hypothetical protein
MILAGSPREGVGLVIANNSARRAPSGLVSFVIGATSGALQNNFERALKKSNERFYASRPFPLGMINGMLTLIGRRSLLFRAMQPGANSRDRCDTRKSRAYAI